MKIQDIMNILWKMYFKPGEESGNINIEITHVDKIVYITNINVIKLFKEKTMSKKLLYISVNSKQENLSLSKTVAREFINKFLEKFI